MGDLSIGRGSVSIPERVWGGLEPRSQKLLWAYLLFQSLRGFGVDWSLGRV
ncbi:hypothetical protein GFS31_43830 (plasmid) [Leptolyngbya sp. BL0902]|nr:hypothetical protein GFS31_43830 [Leptolyngbya sp. BL0902]